MTELRFMERIMEAGNLHEGSVQRILQARSAPYAPWMDVPLVTLGSQQAAAQELQDDAIEDVQYGSEA